MSVNGSFTLDGNIQKYFNENINESHESLTDGSTKTLGFKMISRSYFPEGKIEE